jgi:hypothetical protein
VYYFVLWIFVHCAEMDVIPDKTKADIKKMSDVRLVNKLTQAGVPVEKIEVMDRPALMNAWAEIIVTGKEAVAQGHEPHLDKQRLEFEMRKYEEEREVRRLETERAERREKEERDIQRQEIALKREELQLRVQESARKDTPAARIKFYGDAIRNTAFKMGNDPLDIIHFFSNIERLFTDFDVPNELQVSLMRPYLNEQARSLLSHLDSTRAASYVETKKFLLHEFQISSPIYLNRFNTLKRNSDETFVLFCARLNSLPEYYLDSRRVGKNFDRLKSLLVCDRIKATLSEGCLRHVISVESASTDGFLTHDRLCDVIDVYRANHIADRPIANTMGQSLAMPSPANQTNNKPNLGKSCFRCGSKDHLVSRCPQRDSKQNHQGKPMPNRATNNYYRPQSNARVNSCG